MLALAVHGSEIHFLVIVLILACLQVLPQYLSTLQLNVFQVPGVEPGCGLFFTNLVTFASFGGHLQVDARSSIQKLGMALADVFKLDNRERRVNRLVSHVDIRDLNFGIKNRKIGNPRLMFPS